MSDDFFKTYDGRELPVRPLGSAVAAQIAVLAPLELNALTANIEQEGQREPIVVGIVGDDHKIVDGFHRAVICEQLGIEPKIRHEHFETTKSRMAYAIEVNFHRRQMDGVTRAETIALLADLAGVQFDGKGGPQAASVAAFWKSVGVKERTGREHQRALRELPAAKLQDVRDGKLTLHRALKIHDRGERERNKPRRKSPVYGEPPRLIHSSCVGLVHILEPESVDVIITDPPYPRKFLHCWSELAACAAHVLKPGGSVFAMSGQSFLPEVIQRLLEPDELKWHWELNYGTPGEQKALIPMKVIPARKPILWVVKGKYTGKTINDEIVSPHGAAKDLHEWQQSVAGMNIFVERCSEGGDVVLDPFMASGTTAECALQLGRRFIGCDIDADAVAKTESRLQERGI